MLCNAQRERERKIKDAISHPPFLLRHHHSSARKRDEPGPAPLSIVDRLPPEIVHAIYESTFHFNPKLPRVNRLSIDPRTQTRFAGVSRTWRRVVCEHGGEFHELGWKKLGRLVELWEGLWTPERAFIRSTKRLQLASGERKKNDILPLADFLSFTPHLRSLASITPAFASTVERIYLENERGDWKSVMGRLVPLRKLEELRICGAVFDLDDLLR